MAKKEPKSKSTDVGNYVWRGGQKIEIQKEDDRFTVLPSSQEHLERLLQAPGVRAIKPVTNQVFKVETTATERDAAMSSLRSDAYKTIVHHAYRPKEGEGTVYYLTDTLIVRFDAKATSKQIDKGAQGIRRACPHLPATGNREQRRESNQGGQSARGRTHGGLRRAQHGNRFQPAFIPTDGLFKRQWHLNATAGPQLVADASVQAPAVWDTTHGERSIVVALIDDRFDLNHPDFQGPSKVVAPKDYVDGDANPFPESVQGDYHGTPCAGVAIAESNGRGVVGVAHGCGFMPVRFPLSADDDLLIEIFEEVSLHADVISCSWGPPPVVAPLPLAISETFKRLAKTGGPRGKGYVICFAAGDNKAPLNDPANAGGFLWLGAGSWLPRRTSGPILNGFAAHPNVVAVAASTSLNKHLAYSNWGAEISVCAPSNNFHPLDSQQFVPGRGIWTTDNETFGAGFTARSRYTGRFGGTSSATPLVAGVAPLVLSANPDLTAAEVKDVLQSSADKIVDTDPDVVLGTNRGQYDTKSRCDWFGFGKVNAAKAVAEAARRRGP